MESAAPRHPPRDEVEAVQNEQYAEAGTPEREAQALEKKARGGQLGAQSGCQELRVLQKQTFLEY